MNSPLDGGIHFIEDDKWGYYRDAVHGQGAMLFPTGLDDTKSPLPETDPLKLCDGDRHFKLSDSGRNFDYPFYFGVIREMMYLIMADTYENLRFFMSPSGGGSSIIPGQSNPAWDFGVIRPPLQPGERYETTFRIAFLSPDDTYMADTAVAEFEEFNSEYPIQTG